MERRKRILIVDDERQNRELLDAILTGFGHDIDMASSGLEALAKLDATHDLILLDLMMPGIDGFEVARRIRSESAFSDIPICMVTAHTEREARLTAVEVGANDFVSKPIDKTELKIRISSLLKTKEALDSIKDYRSQLELKNTILENNIQEIQKASELKDEFVRIASHDLKNPLTCIIGFASIIEGSIKPGQPMTEQGHMMLSLITSHAHTMVKIIRDFLDFQSLEAGSFRVIREQTDLNQIAQTALEQHGSYANSKDITLSLQLTENMKPCFADPSHLCQVMDNLIGNAIKFGPRNGRVKIQTRQSDDHVMLEVIDNAPGLAEEDLIMLFVKYARLSNKPTGSETSTGLGLSICKRIIELNGGEIGGGNNLEGGATFWFKLPIAVNP